MIFVENLGKCNADQKTTIIIRTIWVKSCYLRFSILNVFEIENSMSFDEALQKLYVDNIVHIGSWLEFARNIAKFNIDQLYVMLTKIDQSLLNGQHGSAHIVPD